MPSSEQPASLENAIKWAARWLHKGAPLDEAEATIRSIVRHAQVGTSSATLRTEAEECVIAFINAVNEGPLDPNDFMDRLRSVVVKHRALIDRLGAIDSEGAKNG